MCPKCQRCLAMKEPIIFVLSCSFSYIQLMAASLPGVDAGAVFIYISVHYENAE